MATYLEEMDAIIDHVISRMRKDTESAALRAQVVAWCNESQYEDIPEDAYFLQADGTPITFDGSASYSLATDFDRMILNGVRTTDPERILIPKSMEWLDARDPAWDTTGNPTYYGIWDEKIYLQSVPSSGTCLYRYYKVQTELTDSNASVPVVPLRHRHILVLGALSRGRKWIDDAGMADRVDYQLQQAIDKLSERNNRIAGFPAQKERNVEVEALFRD